MPLEQAGQPSSAGPRQSDLNPWIRLQSQGQSHRPAHTPVPIPVPGQPPAPAFTFGGVTIPTLANPPRNSYGGSYSGHDDDQDEVSQQLLGQYQQHIYPPTSHADHRRRNGGSAGNSRRGSPAHNAARQLPGRLMGSTSLSSSAYPQQTLQNRPSRMRQFGPASSSSANNNNNSSSAMETDELANTKEEDEESDVPPLVMSDLDPRYAKKAPTPKQSPSQASHSSPPAYSKTPHAPSLSLRQPQTPHNSSTNGTKKSTTTPLRPPVVSIPLGVSPHSSSQRSQPSITTPGRMAPMTVSVSLPSLYTPKAAGSATGDNMAAPPPMATKTKLPVVAVGRRSKISNLGVAPVKGRPKGWKPGMTYREVALRNAGVDPNDPSVPREILMPPRAKKSGRPPGRPRLPGGPRPKPSSSHAGAFGFKKVGRPPIQPIEAVQRSIFCSEQACFAPFMCEWNGCRAELQNMATLRKHVAVVHGRPEDTAKTCQWRQCASVRNPPVLYMGATDTDSSGRTFLEHVEYQHLAPLEWHRGDGFANNGHVGPPPPPVAGALLAKSRTIKPKAERGSGTPIPSAEPPTTDMTGPSSHWAPEVGLDGIPIEELPRYLLDDNGKQVTPLLRDGLLESSTAFWTQEERGRRLKELYRQLQQNMNKRPERGLSRIV